MAAETLVDQQGIRLSAETVRGGRRAAGGPPFQRRERPYRAWRARKAPVGEWVPVDGSPHDGFEGRGPRCGLMAYLDEARSQVCARLYTYEGTIPAMDRVETDKHRTSRALGEPTVAPQVVGEKRPRQLERALAERGVTVIQAHSPQAKGRGARLVTTRQDRLVKELRLAGLSTSEAAHQCVETWRPRGQPARGRPAGAGGRSASAESHGP